LPLGGARVSHHKSTSAKTNCTAMAVNTPATPKYNAVRVKASGSAIVFRKPGKVRTANIRRSQDSQHQENGYEELHKHGQQQIPAGFARIMQSPPTHGHQR